MNPSQWWRTLYDGTDPDPIEAASPTQMAELMDRLHARPLTPQQMSRARRLILHHWGGTVLMEGIRDG
jgi:hypothetical protein